MVRSKQRARQHYRRYVLCEYGVRCVCKGWQWADKLEGEPFCMCGGRFAEPVPREPPPAPWKSSGEAPRTQASQEQPGKRTKVAELVFLADQAAQVLGEASATTRHLRDELEGARRERDAAKPAATRLREAEQNAERKQKAKDKAREKLDQARSDLATAEAEHLAADRAYAEAQAEHNAVKASVAMVDVPAAQSSPGLLPAAYISTLGAEERDILERVSSNFAEWQRRQAGVEPSAFVPDQGSTPQVVPASGDDNMEGACLLDEVFGEDVLDKFIAAARGGGADLDAVKRTFQAQIRGKTQEAKRARRTSRSRSPAAEKALG